ncbi:AAA+-type ATPase [Ceratobasidium sp. 395]|nr:AAA+-type ATPase [Ceratobasidium sp. 395]
MYNSQRGPLTKYIEETSLSYNSVKALGPTTPSKVQLWKPPVVNVHRATRISIQEQSSTRPTPSQRAEWLKLLARETLIDLKYVVKGQVFEVPFEGRPRVFRVVGVESDEESTQEVSQNLASLSLADSPNWSEIVQNAAELDWDTQVEVTEEPKSKPSPPTPNVGSPYSTVGGLDKQIAAVRDLIEIPLTNPQLFHQFGALPPQIFHHSFLFLTSAPPYLGLKPPKGILLYGPPGTGKTHLARAIAQETHASLLAVSGAELASAYHGETEARLRAVFADARSRSPCIIVLDEVDAMCPRREDSGGGGGVEARVVATLLTEMDGIDSANKGDGGDQPRIVVVATTNRPNAIDPALRRPGRFDREIEIGIPDAPARFAILQVLLRGTPHTVSAHELHDLASRTHGYVGADLGAVVRDAGTRAIKRTVSTPNFVTCPITASDLEHALLTIRPSGLRELALDTPETRWTDVGGQAEVQARLRESVEWPLKHPEAFARLGIKPPAGVLMYGPPGCSKTLIARALATESGVNFVAVKGPELLNKYVGESERAFHLLYFPHFTDKKKQDEIDALATARESGDGRAHDGVLTSLLNEMDGIQALVGVTVVAATNRPDVLDSALMRPGRLDKLLYVGPPDKAGRLDILRVRTRSMAVDPALDLDLLAELSHDYGTDSVAAMAPDDGCVCIAEKMINPAICVESQMLTALLFFGRSRSIDQTEGCSGAEIAAVCQDAALMTLRADMDAGYVRRDDFEVAARAIKRQITHAMVAGYEAFGR